MSSVTSESVGVMARESGNDWADATLAQLPLERQNPPVVRNYINGEWVSSQGKELVDIVNPANGKILARTPIGTTADVDKAVAVAKETFKTWRQVPTIDRVQYLFKLKTLLEEHAEELAKLCTLE